MLQSFESSVYVSVIFHIWKYYDVHRTKVFVQFRIEFAQQISDHIKLFLNGHLVFMEIPLLKIKKNSEIDASIKIKRIERPSSELNNKDRSKTTYDNVHPALKAPERVVLVQHHDQNRRQIVVHALHVANVKVVKAVSDQNRLEFRQIWTVIGLVTRMLAVCAHHVFFYFRKYPLIMRASD